MVSFLSPFCKHLTTYKLQNYLHQEVLTSRRWIWNSFKEFWWWANGANQNWDLAMNCLHDAARYKNNPIVGMVINWWSTATRLPQYSTIPALLYLMCFYRHRISHEKGSASVTSIHQLQREEQEHNNQLVMSTNSKILHKIKRYLCTQGKIEWHATLDVS